MTKKFNLRFCLQSSTKITIFKTLLALLDITSMSRFETDRIFLKRNFKIWILFFHFPLFVFISNDLLILRHFNWIWIKSITQIFVFLAKICDLYLPNFSIQSIFGVIWRKTGISSSSSFVCFKVTKIISGLWGENSHVKTLDISRSNLWLRYKIRGTNISVGSTILVFNENS